MTEKYISDVVADVFLLICFILLILYLKIKEMKKVIFYH